MFDREMGPRVLRHILPEWFMEGTRVDLTESQQAFLAIASGVPAENLIEDGKLVTRTAPCALVFRAGCWEIIYQAKKG